MIEKQILIVQDLLRSPLGIFDLLISIVIRLCVLIIFVAIAVNFIKADQQKNTKNEKKSFVETGTMILFFLAFYFIIKTGWGAVKISNLNIRVILSILGIWIVVLGTAFNILGRLALGSNWANQVKIYSNQTLVQAGVYKIVRHPLYASLIWMFFASSVIYLNWIAFLANLLIFIPFMTYRAKQEESLLSKQFPDYKVYQQKVGMFFPKLEVK